MNTKRWMVLNKETEISHSYHDTREEAEKLASEMTAYHEREYIVRERNILPEPAPKVQPTKDCLGRKFPTDVQPDPPRRQLLSEHQIDEIARESHTKPVSEIGRHVPSLLQHLVGLDLRMCKSCRHWVAYNRPEDLAIRGECTNPSVRSHVVAIEQSGGYSGEPIAVVTPFDWSCKTWEERASAESDAMSCPA